MVYKDLEVIEKVKEYTVYSVGMFKDKIPKSSLEIRPEFLEKIKLICSDYNYAAFEVPFRYFECAFCKKESLDESLDPPGVSSLIVWIKVGTSIYSFPGTLYHLIKIHNYSPPIEFMAAIMNPQSEAVLRIYEDDNKSKINKEVMEKLKGAYNSRNENVEKKEMDVNGVKIEILRKKTPTLLEKLKDIWTKK